MKLQNCFNFSNILSSSINQKEKHGFQNNFERDSPFLICKISSCSKNCIFKFSNWNISERIYWRFFLIIINRLNRLTNLLCKHRFIHINVYTPNSLNTEQTHRIKKNLFFIRKLVTKAKNRIKFSRETILWRNMYLIPVQ